MNSEALEHPGNFKCLPFVDFQRNLALTLISVNTWNMMGKPLQNSVYDSNWFLLKFSFYISLKGKGQLFCML